MIRRSEIKEKIASYPTKYSKEYKKFPKFHRIKSMYVNLKCLEHMTHKHNLLDVGCSDGIFLDLVSRYFPDIKLTGIDMNKKVVDYARKVDISIEYKHGDVTSLPIQDNDYDVVTCFETLEHVKNYKKALDELIRASNFWIMITVPRETGVIGRFKNLGRKVLKRKNSHKWFDYENILSYIDSLEKKKVINSYMWYRNLFNVFILIAKTRGEVNGVSS